MLGVPRNVYVIGAHALAARALLFLPYMKTKTKLFALGAMGAFGAAAIGTTRALRRRARATDVDSLFDASDVNDQQDVKDTSDVGDIDDIREPIIVTEEVVVITDVGPYEVDLELIPGEPPGSRNPR